MKLPKDHIKEAERLKSLEAYSVLDSLPEEDYDNLTSLAAQICGTPVSLITLLDDKRQWFKSNHGLKVRETPKDYAFCAHTITIEEDLLVVEDARKDDRFYDNPLVTDDPNVIFYAGATLTDINGLPLGTLCVIDHKPNHLQDSQIKALIALAQQVMRLLELRKSKMAMEKANKALKMRNQELEKFADIAAHDLKSPLNNITALTKMLSTDFSINIDEHAREIIQMIEGSAKTLKELISGLLEYSKSADTVSTAIEKIDIVELSETVGNLFTSEEDDVRITTNSNVAYLHTNKSALERILINLFSNSIKYNDKAITEIELKVEEKKRLYKITITDNGPGIPPAYQKKVFQLFQTLSTKDKFGKLGTGIGLATVQKTVESLGGKIGVDPKKTSGVTIIIKLPK